MFETSNINLPKGGIEKLFVFTDEDSDMNLTNVIIYPFT